MSPGRRGALPLEAPPSPPAARTSRFTHHRARLPHVGAALSRGAHPRRRRRRPPFDATAPTRRANASLSPRTRPRPGDDASNARGSAPRDPSPRDAAGVAGRGTPRGARPLTYSTRPPSSPSPSRPSVPCSSRSPRRADAAGRRLTLGLVSLAAGLAFMNPRGTTPGRRPPRAWAAVPRWSWGPGSTPAPRATRAPPLPALALPARFVLYLGRVDPARADALVRAHGRTGPRATARTGARGTADGCDGAAHWVVTTGFGRDAATRAGPPRGVRGGRAPLPAQSLSLVALERGARPVRRWRPPGPTSSPETARFRRRRSTWTPRPRPSARPSRGGRWTCGRPLGTSGARWTAGHTWDACARRWRGLLAQVRAPLTR